MTVGFLKQNEAGEFFLSSGIASSCPLQSGLQAASSFERIIFPAEISKSILLEFEFKQHLRGQLLYAALESKLETLLPVPISEICWGFIQSRNRHENYLVYAMDRQSFQELLDNLK